MTPLIQTLVGRRFRELPFDGRRFLVLFVVATCLFLLLLSLPLGAGPSTSKLKFAADDLAPIGTVALVLRVAV